jgi:hypothetical protein
MMRKENEKLRTDFTKKDKQRAGIIKEKMSEKKANQ